MHSTPCSHRSPTPDPPQPWEPPALAPAQAVQGCCLETNKVSQRATAPQLPPPPWLCPARGSVSSMSAVSCWPPSLPSPWASGWVEGPCLEKATAWAWALRVHHCMSCGEQPLILRGPVRPRRLILTWGEGRLKGPQGAFLWHWSPRMEDAATRMGVLQPQPLSLEVWLLAHRRPQGPTLRLQWRDALPNSPQGHGNQGMGTRGGRRCAGLQMPPWPLGLTATLLASFAADLPCW